MEIKIKVVTPHLSIPASCGSCGIYSCNFNAEAMLCGVPLAQEAWLLDESWPEFDTYLSKKKSVDALGFIPLKGSSRLTHGYQWHCLAERHVETVTTVALRRSLAMRNIRLNGGTRQKILENFDRKLAAAYSKKIPYHVGRLVVWQNLLPFLFQNKILGGREFEVLMWRAPRHVLEMSLNIAAQYYRESTTLRDFRSDPVLKEAERFAFEAAASIVTPHRSLARLYPEKTQILDWDVPLRKSIQNGEHKTAFLGPTVARRGAYVVREAMQKLGLPLVVLGQNFEHPDFWKHLPTEQRGLVPDSLRDISLLLSPCITDFKPRWLIKALTLGVQVIASTECGLPPTEGLHFVDTFDAEELARKILEVRST